MKNYLKNQIIYQVYVRNFTKEGTFNAFNKYIDYIKDLGTDIIYFMPVNTIGKINRKGDLGSPYSIKDYYEINPELGTLEDFKNTINLIHSKNMKVMLDIVFNHTSRDSVLLKTHPEWFYKNKEGKLTSKAGDWTDVYDLEYTNNPELIDYLCNVIRYYIELGIDGFRFDVASLVSKDFYLTLKNTVLKEYPNTIMLAEAIDAGFTLALRKEGFKVSVSIIPYLVAIMVGISMFRASGIIEYLGQILSPILSHLNVSADLIPLMIVRPLSGSAALGIFSDIAHSAGPEAFTTKLAAIMVGSSETTFYVLAVYFGAVGITKLRYALIVGLIADIIGIVAAVSVSHWLFA